MRFGRRLLCASQWQPPIVRGTGSAMVAGGPSGAAVQNKHFTHPVPLNSTFGVGERSLERLCEIEEKRREKRMAKMFGDIELFEGGIIQDHQSLGRKMIFRDFVHYALYHNKWGYYPKLYRRYRSLMTNCFFDPIPFGGLRNKGDYDQYVTDVFHASPSYSTPATLFQPYYGWVLAEYFLSVMRAKFDPSEPLVIYEAGAGSGTMALTILDYLAEHFPDVYERCEYHLIEMNPMLIPIQRNRLIHHYHHVQLHNINALNWRQVEHRRCFYLCFELFNNMPHDHGIWDNDLCVTEQWVYFEQTDNLSTGKESFRAARDPLILRYLRYAQLMQEDTFHALTALQLSDGKINLDPPRFESLDPSPYDGIHVILTKSLRLHTPFYQMYFPTAQMLLLENLAQYFPRHHLFVGDWNHVAEPLWGHNGPLVQMKMRMGKELYLRRTCESIMNNAGYVDLCFPTNFEHLEKVYKNVCGDHKEIMCTTHPDFWKTFGGDKAQLFTTRSGFNPLLEEFSSFSIFSSHHPQES